MHRPSLLIVFAVVLLGLVTGCGPEAPRVKSPGEAEFREANKRIIRLEGKATQGNNPQAEELAALFAKSVAALREATIEKGNKDGFSLSKGKMLVFCQLTETHCAFLIHVPELRKFTREAKDLMADVSWYSAQLALRSQGVKRANLAVGVKGAMLYSTIMIGETIDDDNRPDRGIRERSDKMSLLYPFFVRDGGMPAGSGTAAQQP